MGCNCKNKAQRVETKIKTIDNVMVIPNQTPPPYTWEEIMELKHFIDNRIQTEQSKNRIYEFNKNYFGELIEGYCDILCMNRTKQRVELAIQRLTEWDELNKN